jgi:methylated-DNA-[protein]-cysteine S-methyltransferase
VFDALITAPFGAVGLVVVNDLVTRIDLLPAADELIPPANATAHRAAAQLVAYFDDPSRRLDFPHAAQGTGFRQTVWRAISRIPIGETVTYAELARRVGSVPRAVGQACGENPLPLIVPCHRVVSQAGLGGFGHRASGYLPTVKRWLLAHEAAKSSLC